MSHQTFISQFAPSSYTGHAAQPIPIPAAAAREKEWEGCFSCRWRKKRCSTDAGDIVCSDCRKFNIRCTGAGQERPPGKPLAELIRKATKQWISDKANRLHGVPPLDLEPIWQTQATNNTPHFVYVDPSGAGGQSVYHHAHTTSYPPQLAAPPRSEVNAPLYMPTSNMTLYPIPGSRAYSTVPVANTPQYATCTIEVANNSHSYYNTQAAPSIAYPQQTQFYEPEYTYMPPVMNDSPYSSDAGSFEYLGVPSSQGSDHPSPMSSGAPYTPPTEFVFPQNNLFPGNYFPTHYDASGPAWSTS